MTTEQTYKKYVIAFQKAAEAINSVSETLRNLTKVYEPLKSKYHK